MEIELLAHRGLWSQADQGNTLAALTRALEKGYGVETDVRDYGGRLVISHDPADSAAVDFSEFCRCYVEAGACSTLALNIKSDGLADQLQQVLAEYGVTNYFVFDMSVPDAMRYAQRSLPLFSRHSEVEPHVSLYEQCAGVWLDAFWSDWFEESNVVTHLNSGKDVCVVSPELHGRPKAAVWQWLREVHRPPGRRLMLCTDHPEEFEQG